MAAERVKLVSSNIEEAMWVDSKEELMLTFRGGRVYTYLGVPYHVFVGLTEADSPGKYFHENILGKFIAFKEA